MLPPWWLRRFRESVSRGMRVIDMFRLADQGERPLGRRSMSGSRVRPLVDRARDALYDRDATLVSGQRDSLDPP